MNNNSDFLKGFVRAFDTISHFGEILISDEEEVVYIEPSYSEVDPLFFSLIKKQEFLFNYKENAGNLYFVNHLLNTPQQLETKKSVLKNYIKHNDSDRLFIEDLVNKLGFERNGARVLFEDLKKENFINYRIVGRGELIVELNNKDNLTKEKRSIRSNKSNLSVEELYELSKNLDEFQQLEFQNSMNIDIIRVKFLTISWSEIVDILNSRLEVNKNKYLKEINDLKSSRNLQSSNTNKETEELEKDYNLFHFGIAETNNERDYRLEKLKKEREAKEKELNEQRKRNELLTGFLETNEERAKREKLEILLAKKKKEEEEREKELLAEKEKNFDETGIYETNKERTTRELSAETILVDSDEIDTRNKRRQYSDQKKIFVKKLKIGDYLKAEIINVTDNVYWVEVNGFKAMIPRKLVLSYQGEFKSGETISTEVVGIDYKRLHITLKPAAKKPAAKKPAAKKPAAKKNSNKLELFFDNSSLLDKNKSSTKLFGDYVKSALKIYGTIETSLTFPANKKKIRLINSGIESGWLNEEGLMTVVINDYNTTAELLFLINKYVQPKDRSNCYRKLPEAVPLFLEHELVRQHKKTLKKNFEIFLEYADKTGKNPWKKFHDPEVITYLNKVQIAKIKY